jgi:hypothetical protein
MTVKKNLLELSSVGIAAIALSTLPTLPAAAATFTNFTPVVNNSYLIPETDHFFNSYNQPSVNDRGLVVFRARSQGGSGEQPSTGIFTRDMLGLGPIEVVATRNDPVPPPNNTNATFNEFPSFPRIDSGSDMLAFRGQSQPVWEYQLPDGSKSRAGTSGVFTTDSTNTLITGANQLGFLEEFAYWQVPGSPEGTKFDQFPGAPSPTDGHTIVFKGNWTDTTDPANPTGQTGVYFRNIITDTSKASVQKIADSTTTIPGSPKSTTFGSTAPPSAASGKAVFLGVDNEENPTEGGLYYASLLDDPTLLKTIIALNTEMVTTDGKLPITRIGEAISFDGKHVAFWGALGDETRSITLTCPTEGNQARIKYCKEQYPDGFKADVPTKQGLFLANLATAETRLVIETGEDFSDFLFWNFSGRAPGMGEGEDDDDLELARWRSTSFLAVDGSSLVFKGLKASGVEGLYAAISMGMPIETIVETGMMGDLLDPSAANLKIASVGIERDGFRNRHLAFNASMAEGDSSWAGIYYTRATPAQIPTPALLPGLIGMGIATLKKRYTSRQASNRKTSS